MLSDCSNGRKHIGERMARGLETAAGLPQGYLDDETECVDIHIVSQKKIPLYDWNELDDPGIFLKQSKEYLMTDYQCSNASFFVSIADNSMSPKINADDKVLVDMHVTPKPADIVLAQTTKGFVLRKYRVTGDDTFDLVPFNDDFPTTNSSRAKVVGVMVEHRIYRK